MIAQGRAIASWGENVNVKIPVTTTKGAFTGPVIAHARRRRRDRQRDCDHDCRAGRAGRRVPGAERSGDRVCVRRARLPTPAAIPCRSCAMPRSTLAPTPKAELLWASPRELLNIFQADEIGCHIITVSHDVLGQALACRQGPRRIFAGNGQDVSSRRHRGRLQYRDLPSAGRRPDSTASRSHQFAVRQYRRVSCRTSFRTCS